MPQEHREDHLDGMYVPIEKAELVLRLLLQGNSVSTVERVTEVHHTTILKLLILAGDKCERIMADKVRNVEVRDVECDDTFMLLIVGLKNFLSLLMRKIVFGLTCKRLC